MPPPSPGRMRGARDVFSLQLGLPGVFGLLHLSGGMILVRIAADQAEILTVGVAPEARRNGIATTLLSEATTRRCLAWRNGDFS